MFCTVRRDLIAVPLKLKEIILGLGVCSLRSVDSILCCKIAVDSFRSFDAIWYLGRNSCMMMVMLYAWSLRTQSHRAGGKWVTRRNEYLCGPPVPVTDEVRLGCMVGQSDCKKTRPRASILASPIQSCGSC
jgi:hypothetical protein